MVVELNVQLGSEGKRPVDVFFVLKNVIHSD